MLYLQYLLYIKVLFIVLSLAAALLLPISRIIEVKSLPTRRDSATLHSGVTDLFYIIFYQTPSDNQDITIVE